MVVAVYIDPAVCHTWLGYLIPECYGIIPLVGLTLPLALAAAWSRRRIAQVAR